MYSFEPNEEQQMLVEAVRKYAVNDLRPAAHDSEEARALPQKLVQTGEFFTFEKAGMNGCMWIFVAIIALVAYIYGA